jgi:hypothetical protein
VSEAEEHTRNAETNGAPKSEHQNNTDHGEGDKELPEKSKPRSRLPFIIAGIIILIAIIAAIIYFLVTDGEVTTDAAYTTIPQDQQGDAAALFSMSRNVFGGLGISIGTALVTESEQRNQQFLVPHLVLAYQPFYVTV